MCDVCVLLLCCLCHLVPLSPVQLLKELFGVLSVPRKDPFEILLSFLLFIPRASDISSLPLISFSLHLSVPCRASFWGLHISHRRLIVTLSSTLLSVYRSALFSNATTEKDPDVKDFDLSGIYSSKADWGAQFRAPSTLQTFDENGRNGNPNGLTRKQEMMVRSAIKYWVERHKHVVR